MTDSISDTLTRIRNAQAVKRQTVIIPFSKLRMSLVKVLVKEGWLESVETRGRKIKKNIEVKLKYEQGEPFISRLKRISKPGQRIYLKKNQLRPVRQGYGLAVISTSRGLMSDKQAKNKGLGGEILCEVY